MSQAKDESIFIACFAIAIALTIFTGKMVWGSYTCSSRAHAQNLGSEYGVMSGCVYKLPDGRKVLEDKYRVAE